MSFQIAKEKMAGSIKPVALGKGKKAVAVGGASCYPFYLFEGDMPNKPKIAMEVWDMEPTGWPESAKAHFKDVLTDPGAWAKKCVDKFGADLIVLQLKSIDPNDKNAPAEEAVNSVKKVLKAIKVPLIIWGCANPQKDEEVFKKISEACQEDQLIIGPVDEKNHKAVGASAMGYGHTVISSSPIDVNIAKQMNILLENLGVSQDRMLIDPTTGGLGYGLEYSYSVMERIQMAALGQGDEKLQLPIINNLANEIWKSKEANQNVVDAPLLGDPERRGILMEAVGAVCYLLAGSSILILRHPEAVRLVRAFIDLMTDGGSALNVAGIQKKLADVDIDFAKLAPEPNLSLAENNPKKNPPKKAEEQPEATPEAKAAPPAPKAEAPKVEEKAVPKPDISAKAKSDSEVRAKREAQEKMKAEIDAMFRTEAAAKAKADAETKAKADAEAKAESEAMAKAQAEARAKADEKARSKRELEEQELKEKRAKEREELQEKREAAGRDSTIITAAVHQKSEVEKILMRLDWIHRRA